MSIGDPISQPIPVVSTPGTGYATQIYNFLQEVKARLEGQIPLSSLLPGTFDMDNNPLITAEYLGLYDQVNNTSQPVGSLFMYQGNLWYMSDTGAAQVTSGSSINASAIAGIGGDYGGVNPALVEFIDADNIYNFWDDAGGAVWARLAARSIDIYGGASSTNRVRVTWAGGSDWTLTLPDAPPATNGTLLQINTSGEVDASSSGLAAISLAANQDISVSGTGGYNHGDQVVNKSFIVTEAIGGNSVIGVNVQYRSSGTLPGAQLSSGTTAYFPLPVLPSEKRIKSIKIYNGAAPTNNVTYTFALVGVAGILDFADSSTETTTSSSQSPTLTFSAPYSLNNALNSGDVVPYLKIQTGSGVSATLATPVVMKITYDEA